MQFKYMGDTALSGVNKQMLDQFEVWTLNSLVEVAREDLQVAAELFGTSVETLVARLEKHGLMPTAN